MKRLTWHLSLVGRKLGVLGILGLILMVCALGFNLYKVTPMRKALAKEEIQPIKVKLISEIEQKLPDTPAQQVGKFIHSLPDLNTFPRQLKELNKMTTQLQIEVPTSQYRLLQNAKNQSWQGIEIQMPIKASYAQLKKLIGMVLQKQSNTALLGVQLGRETASQGLLNADLVWVFYFKAEGFVSPESSAVAENTDKKIASATTAALLDVPASTVKGGR